MSVLLYQCPLCGNVVEKLVDSGVAVQCCGREMIRLQPQTDAVHMELHQPMVTLLDPCTLNVQVGNALHPMTDFHHISFIYVESKRGGMYVNLDERLDSDFCVCADTPIAIYDYCNLHGLWKTTL